MKESWKYERREDITGGVGKDRMKERQRQMGEVKEGMKEWG